MKDIRFNFSTICYERTNCIYVIGGRSYGSEKEAILKSCEKYDIQKDVWISISPLKRRRCQSQCKLIGNKIFVIGGYSLKPKRPILEIEFLNLYEDNPSWVEYDFIMIPPLYGFTGISIDNYTYMILGGKGDNK